MTAEQGQDDFDVEIYALSEVIMAVNMTERGTVGCAYYVARNEKLYFMEDVVMGGADVVDACELRRYHCTDPLLLTLKQ